MKLDLTGNVYGRLTVLYEGERRRSPSGAIRRQWVCKCECGNIVEVTTASLRNGHTVSCGCYNKDNQRERNTLHGLSKTEEYKLYRTVKSRCGKVKGYESVGMCAEWDGHPEVFIAWLHEHEWRHGLQIDREDNHKGYSPDNCRLVIPKVNVRNRDCTLRCKDGVSLADVCDTVGISTRENGKKSKAYMRIMAYFRTHNGEAHPELVEAANRTILEMRQCLELLRLLDDIKAFKAQLHI